jgi:hypothetical protein
VALGDAVATPKLIEESLRVWKVRPGCEAGTGGGWRSGLPKEEADGTAVGVRSNPPWTDVAAVVDGIAKGGMTGRIDVMG